MRRDVDPLRLDGGDRGVLCIHGFTGTPYEMSYLAEKLHERGFTAVAMRLPGHGTYPDELDATSWRQWVSSVAEEFDALRRRTRQVVVIGQSLGGLLALDLAADRPREVAGVVSLATPLWLFGLPTALIRLLRRFPVLLSALRTIPKLGGSDVSDRDMRRSNPAYSVIPARGLLQLAEFMERVRGRLSEVEVPILIVHARNDHTAPYACAQEIANRVRGPVRLHALTSSYHLIAFDVERDEVVAEVLAFLDDLQRSPVT
jgi:carboxylesterase